MKSKQTQFYWYDVKTDKLKCLVCGFYYSSLPQHIRIHEMTTSEYKLEFNIFYTTPLVSVQRQREMSDNVVKLREERRFVVCEKGIQPTQLIGKESSMLGVNKKNYKEFDNFRKIVGETAIRSNTGRVPHNKGSGVKAGIICKNCKKVHTPKHRAKVEFCGISCARKYYWKQTKLYATE